MFQCVCLCVYWLFQNMHNLDEGNKTKCVLLITQMSMCFITEDGDSQIAIFVQECRW